MPAQTQQNTKNTGLPWGGVLQIIVLLDFVRRIIQFCTKDTKKNETDRIYNDRIRIARDLENFNLTAAKYLHARRVGEPSRYEEKIMLEIEKCKLEIKKLNYEVTEYGANHRPSYVEPNPALSFFQKTQRVTAELQEYSLKSAQKKHQLIDDKNGKRTSIFAMNSEIEQLKASLELEALKGHSANRSLVA